MSYTILRMVTSAYFALAAVFICNSSSIACWRDGIYGNIYTFCRMLLIIAWSRRKEGGKEVKVVYHPWPRQLPFDTLRLPFRKKFAYTKMFQHCSKRIGRVLWLTDDDLESVSPLIVSERCAGLWPACFD